MKPVTMKGFTLLELIITMVILTIIAIIALPKYINLSNDARTSTMKGFEGNLIEAANLIHDKAFIENQHLKYLSIIFVEGKPVPLNFGYPALQAKGDDLLPNILDTNIPYYYELDSPGNINLIRIIHEEAKDPEQCYLLYQNAEYSNINGKMEPITPFAVTAHLEGC